MNKNNTFILSFGCFGAIVGAGFASGKEIWLYFARFGWIAYPILVISGVLFAFLIKFLLDLGKTNKIDSFTQMNKLVFKKYSWIGDIFFVISNIILLAAMFAGSGAIGKIILPQNAELFKISLIFLSLIISLFNFKKLMKLNALIVPLLLIMIIGAFLFSPISSINFPIKMSLMPPIYALIYLCANVYLISFILLKLGFTYQKNHTKASIICACLFIIFSIIISLSLHLNLSFCDFEMPLLAILSSLSDLFKIFASLVIAFSILTSAINIIFALSNWLTIFVKSRFICNLFLCLIGLILSNFGFTFIVNYLYFTIGIFGLVFILSAIKNSP